MTLCDSAEYVRFMPGALIFLNKSPKQSPKSGWLRKLSTPSSLNFDTNPRVFPNAAGERELGTFNRGVLQSALSQFLIFKRIEKFFYFYQRLVFCTRVKSGRPANIAIVISFHSHIYINDGE